MELCETVGAFYSLFVDKSIINYLLKGSAAYDNKCILKIIVGVHLKNVGGAGINSNSFFILHTRLPFSLTGLRL